MVRARASCCAFSCAAVMRRPLLSVTGNLPRSTVIPACRMSLPPPDAVLPALAVPLGTAASAATTATTAAAEIPRYRCIRPPQTLHDVMRALQCARCSDTHCLPGAAPEGNRRGSHFAATLHTPGHETLTNRARYDAAAAR